MLLEATKRPPTEKWAGWVALLPIQLLVQRFPNAENRHRELANRGQQNSTSSNVFQSVFVMGAPPTNDLLWQLQHTRGHDAFAQRSYNVL